jgi:hypothetical protein
MGFIGDLNKLRKQAKEIDKTFSAKDTAARGMERMKEANEMMANQTAAMNAALAGAGAPIQDGIEATAQVLSVGMAAGAINMDLILPVELLIMQEGMPPRPMKVSITVPGPQMQRMVPGSVLPVKLSRSNPNALAVDWFREY